MWIAILTFISGLIIGYENNTIRREILSLKDTILAKKETKPTAISGSPELINEDRLLDKDSSVILPKSPQLIEYEEAQEIERMQYNDRPRK